MEYKCVKKENIGERERQRCLSLMTPERRAAVERISHSGVRESTVCGEWLAKTMLSECSGIPVEEVTLGRAESGKPYAKNLPLHFSLSHSGDYVACAVSETPVGLDLEVRRPRDLTVARRICSPEELDYILAEDSPLRFLLVWTAKEAAVKLTEEGIKGMKAVDYFALAPRLVVEETEDYILSIISSENGTEKRGKCHVL